MADPLSIAGSAIGIISLGIRVSQSLFDYYYAFISQHSDIKDIVQKLDNLLDILEALRDHIKNRQFRTDEGDLVRKIESLVSRCEECVRELGEEAGKFKKCPVNSFQSFVKSTARRVAYPFRKSTLQKLEEDINDIVDHLWLALQLLQQEVIEQVQDDLEEVKTLLNLLRSSQLSHTLQLWLKAPDATINFNGACKKRHPGTGLWLVRGAKFTTWLESPGGFLWLRGFAGCGKSVLCSTAIQYTFRFRKSDPKIGIAFFFFSFDDEKKQDVSALLRALVLQLSGQIPENTTLQSLHDSYRQSAPPDDALLECLHQLIRDFRDVYLLIDALDESPRDKHREAMLETLSHILAWEEPGLHLFVTSRDEIDVRNELDSIPQAIIEMRNNEVDRDIAAFVAQHLRENRKFSKWKRHHDMIQEALTRGAKGVFRWVECQFKSLARCPPSQQLLEQLLRSLPESLDETYARMLRNIAPELVPYAQQMLSILCCSITPPTDLELLDALAIEPGPVYKFDTTRRFDDPSALEEICPGFIEVYISDETQAATVRLAHFSVQEFLESPRILRHHDIAAFHVEKKDGHTQMARICLAILLEPKIKHVDMIEKVAQSYPLLNYAAHYWAEHVLQCGSGEEIEAEALPLFDKSSKNFRIWINHWNVRRYFGELTYATPLYYAALLGLKFTTTALLNCEAASPRSTISTSDMLKIINATHSLYGTSLHAAASKGHKEIIQLLLENDADPNVVGGDYETALQAASYNGHKEIVELLLENGADPNIRTGIHGTALKVVSYNGNKQIAELLLKKGADPNIICYNDRTALQVASSRGHKEIVELLLEKGADLTMVARDFGTSIQEAAYMGHKEVVEVLLEKGADISIEGGDFGGPLEAAALMGHKDVVEMLLEKGADVDKGGGQHGTALKAASSMGNKEMVELLVEKGANVNIVAGYIYVSPRLVYGPDYIPKHAGFCGTPLQTASYEGNKEIVELLLEKGADVNIARGDFGPAIEGAAYKGHRDIVELLIKNGADLNIAAGHYGTALHAAISGNNVEILELLVKKGAEVNTVTQKRGTPLQAASEFKDQKMVNLLLENGADPNIKGEVVRYRPWYEV